MRFSNASPFRALRSGGRQDLSHFARACLWTTLLTLGCGGAPLPLECPKAAPFQASDAQSDEGAFEITVPGDLARRDLEGGAQSAGWYGSEPEPGYMGVTYRYGYFVNPASIIDRTQPTSVTSCIGVDAPGSPEVVLYQIDAEFMLAATWVGLYDSGSAEASLFVMVGVSDRNDLPRALSVIESVRFPDSVPAPVIESTGSPVEVSFPRAPGEGS